jgi:hypothetical protein
MKYKFSYLIKDNNNQSLEVFHLNIPVKRILIRSLLNQQVAISLDGVGKIHDDVRGIPNRFAKTKFML